MNCFEDIKRELVNGHRLAVSYDDFVDKMLSAIQTALNSPVGQELVAPLLENAISSGMTPKAWNQQKTDIMKALFFLTLNECPQLKHEMAGHLYNELRKTPG